MLEGLTLAKKLNYAKIHLQGDSMIIINACINRVSFSWKLKCLRASMEFCGSM